MVGVGVGGDLRVVRFCVYFLMKLVNFLYLVIKYIVIDGIKYVYEVNMEFGEIIIEGFN